MAFGITRALRQELPQTVQPILDQGQRAIVPDQVANQFIPDALQQIQPIQQAPQDFPQTGLIGSEQALRGGLETSLQALQEGFGTARRDISPFLQPEQLQLRGAEGIGAAISQGIQPFQPAIQRGQQAGGVQAALTGALGPEAQSRAFQQFTQDPGQQFLREQGEQAILRGASATGGLGGGNVRRSLARFGQGLAQQQLQQRLQNLGDISGRGLTAAGQVAGLRGTEAGIRGNLTSALLGADVGGRQIGAQAAGQLGDIASRAGLSAADLLTGAGRDVSAGRLQTGRDIASQIGGTTSALSDLIGRQGAGLAAGVETGGINLANLLQGAGQAQAAGQTDLATILANIATQQGSQVAGLPSAAQFRTTEGLLQPIAQAAGGIGTAIAASDSRLKTNITEAGKTSSGINLYTWEWNEEGKKIASDQPTFGVIAQEVMKIIPDAVTMYEDGYYRVDYSRIH